VQHSEFFQKQRFQPTAGFLVATQLVQCSDLHRKNIGKKMKRATI